MTSSRLSCGGVGIIVTCLLVGCTPQPRPVPVTMPAPTTTQWSHRQVRGLEIRTQHWVIYTATTAPYWMEALPTFVEACYAQYQQLVPAPASSRSLTLYVFANAVQLDEFAAQLGATRAAVHTGMNGFAHKGVAAVYAGSPAETLRTIAHMGMHQYLREHTQADLPMWVIEAMATLAEGFDQRGGRFVFEPRYNAKRFSQAREAIQKKWWLDLHDLLTKEDLRKLPSPQVAAQTYLAQLWTLATFLQNDRLYSKGFEQMRLDLASETFGLKLRGYMAAGPEGLTPGEAAFRLYITEDPQEFRHRYWDKTIQYLSLVGY